MALGLAACSPLFARQWIAVELRLMSSSVVPADRGCVIAADEGFGIASVPGLRVLNAHEPEYGLRRCVPLMKGSHHSRLESDNLCPMTIEVSRALAAAALVMELPKSPCLRLAP